MSEEKEKKTGSADETADKAESAEKEQAESAADADDPQARATAAEERAVRQTEKAAAEKAAGEKGAGGKAEDAPEGDAADKGDKEEDGAPAADDKAAALARAKAKAAAAAKARAAGGAGGARAKGAAGAAARPRARAGGAAGGRRRPPRRKAEEKPKEPFPAHRAFLNDLKQAFEGVDFKERLDASDELVIEVPAEKIIEISEYLRDEWGLNYLRSLSGVDWKDRLEAVYSLAALDARGSSAHRVLEAPAGEAGDAPAEKAEAAGEAAEASADGDGAEEGGDGGEKDAPKPAGPSEVPFRLGMHVTIDRDKAEIDSVTPVWPAADFHEREAFDMFGIVFKGHPNLQRILLPENWQGGYPLRKDFVDKRPKKDRKVRPR